MISENLLQRQVFNYGMSDVVVESGSKVYSSTY